MDVHKIRELLNSRDDAKDAILSARTAKNIAENRLGRMREEDPDQFDAIVKTIEEARSTKKKKAAKDKDEDVDGEGDE